MKILNYKTIAVSFIILASSVCGFSVTADEIVQKIDACATNKSSFEITIRVDSYKNDAFEDYTIMKGFVTNGKMTSIEFQEPESMNGRKLIIHDDDIWIVVPNTKNPIRITAAQRMMGGVSYADIVRLYYAENYQARLKGEETISGINPDGNKSPEKNCYILELSSKDRYANYSTVNLWVDEDNFLPVKSDFFARSGKKMTTAYYSSPREWEGGTVLTKIFLYDQVITSKHYIIEYLDMNETGNPVSGTSSENASLSNTNGADASAGN